MDPCVSLNPIVSHSELVSSDVFIAAASERKKRSTRSLKNDFPNASTDTIRKAATEVRQSNNTVSSIQSDISMLSPFLMIMRERNSTFHYELNVDEKNTPFILL